MSDKAGYANSHRILTSVYIVNDVILVLVPQAMEFLYECREAGGMTTEERFLAFLSAFQQVSRYFRTSVFASKPAGYALGYMFFQDIQWGVYSDILALCIVTVAAPSQLRNSNLL